MKQFLFDLFLVLMAYIMDHLGMLILCAFLLFLIWCCMRAGAMAEKKQKQLKNRR